MLTEEDEPTRGILDLDTWDRHNGGVARCCKADCGWEGAPIYRNGQPSTHCPSCEGPDDYDEIEAELDAEEARRALPKVGRNEPCPCGSGKKAKRCCYA
jgi:hypothetical protein